MASRIAGALEGLGIGIGDDVIVNASQAAVDHRQTGDAVLLRWPRPDGTVATLMRQYVEPDLYVVNSPTFVADPIHNRRTPVQVVGVIVERRRSMRRRST